MLILERMLGEKIRIGDDVTATLMEVRNGKAWLGFEAPASVKIDREEIRKVKDQEKTAEAVEKGLDLRTQVAVAISERSWSQLAHRERMYWLALADAAIRSIREVVAQPEFSRWSDSNDEIAIGGIAACSNIVAHLTLGFRPKER